MAIIDAAREVGFRSISIDLIYGLPKQNAATMAQTLSKVIAANPDRIAVYNYAHLPHLFKQQRRIAEVDLPTTRERLALFRSCVERLTEAGYIQIGMDHFAKPTDALAVAQREGRLHRNFQGYSTHADANLVAFGVSAISAVGNTYSQNLKTLEAYYGDLDRGTLPIARGIHLGRDDGVRRALIQHLMCNFKLSFADIEHAYGLDFSSYFSDELKRLSALHRDGLIVLEPSRLEVTATGRLSIRRICMVFDRSLSDYTTSIGWGADALFDIGLERHVTTLSSQCEGNRV